MSHVISPMGRKLIAEFEQGPNGGPALVAYLCPAGVPTIGYGHTAGVKMGDRLPDAAAADALLATDLLLTAKQVDDCLGDSPTTQPQFDAMASLLFNIGAGGFAGSTVLRKHKAGDYNGAAQAFAMWRKATVNGQLVDMPGLIRRRGEESSLYLTPTANQVPIAMPQKVETAEVTPPTGYVETPQGNIVIADIKQSNIVKDSDLGKIVGGVAATASVAAPAVAGIAGMSYMAIFAIAAVILAAGLAYAIYKLVQIKTARIEMNNKGIA